MPAQDGRATMAGGLLWPKLDGAAPGLGSGRSGRALGAAGGLVATTATTVLVATATAAGLVVALVLTATTQVGWLRGGCGAPDEVIKAVGVC